MEPIGVCEGDVCHRNGCEGVMRPYDDGSSCSCHLSPPCSHCVEMVFVCDRCEALTDED